MYALCILYNNNNNNNNNNNTTIIIQFEKFIISLYLTKIH